MTGRVLLDRGVGLAIAVLAAYAWLAAPHIVDGDNAEFAALGHAGGAAHPPGYPLYLLWLRATSWLPGSPAHASALATAILGALTAWVLFSACRAWGARPLAAAAAVAIYAASPFVARVATEAEVFTLNQLVAATVLLVAAKAGPLAGARRIFALGLVAGLGLANHATCVLVAPVGLLGVVRGVRESKLPYAALAVVGLALGLLPYLYLLATAPTTASWGVSSIADHVMRRDYGGPGAFAAHGEPVPASDSLLALVRTLARSWLYLPLAAISLVRPRHETRVAWACLAASFVLAGPVLATRFDIPPVDLGLYVVRRFHLLAVLLLTPAVAVGFDAAGAWLTSRVDGIARFGWAAAFVAFGVALATSLPQLGALHSPAVEYGVRNTLRSLEPNAVLVISADEVNYGAAYLQDAEGERRDVVVVSWSQMKLPWYRDRMAARGVDLDDGDGAASVRLADSLLAAGRPLYVDAHQGNVLRDRPSYPYGTVFRVLPAGSRLPSVAELVAINKKVFDAFDLDYDFPGPDDELATYAHEQYARTWEIIARAATASHDLQQAAFATEIARRIGPQP